MFYVNHVNFFELLVSSCYPKSSLIWKTLIGHCSIQQERRIQHIYIFSKVKKVKSFLPSLVYSALQKRCFQLTIYDANNELQKWWSNLFSPFFFYLFIIHLYDYILRKNTTILLQIEHNYHNNNNSNS